MASGEQHTSRDEKRKRRDSTPTPEEYRGGKHKFARRGSPSVDVDDDPMDGTSRRSRNGYYEDDTPPSNGDENAITQPRQSASHTDGMNHHSSPPASPMPFIGSILPTTESRDIMPLPCRKGKGKGKGGVKPPPPVPRTPPRGITYSAPEEFTPPGAPPGYRRCIPDVGEAGPSNWATRAIPAAPSPPQLPSPERETERRSSVPSPFINPTSPTPAVWVSSPSSLGSMPSLPLPSLTSVPSLFARLFPSAGWHNPIAPADIPTIPSPIAGRQRYLNGHYREYGLDESLPDPEEPVAMLAEKRKYRTKSEFDASPSPKRKRRKWTTDETEAQAEELREQLAIEADILESSARDARMRELEDMEASRARNRAMRLRSQIETGVGADRDSDDENEEDEFFLTVQDLEHSSSPSQPASSSYTDSFDGSPTHGISFNVIGATPDTSLRITSPTTSRGGLHPDDAKEILAQGRRAELTRLASKEFAEALAQQAVQESSSQGQSFNFSFTHVVGQPITHGTGFYNGPPGIHRTYDTPPRRRLRVMVVGEGSRLANDEEVGYENGSDTDVDDGNVTEVDSDHENQNPSRRDSRRYFDPQSDNEANNDGEEPMDSIADSNVNSSVSSSDDEDMALSGGPLFGLSTMGGHLPSLRRLSSFFSLATPPDKRRSSAPPAPLFYLPQPDPQPQTRCSSVPPNSSIGYANVRHRAPQPSARPAEERTDEELAPVTGAPGSSELAAAQPSSPEEAHDQTHSEEPVDLEAEMARLKAELAQLQAEKAALEAEAAQVAEMASAHNGAAGVQLDPYVTSDIQPTIENETESAKEAGAHNGVADAQPSSAPSPTNPATIAGEFVPSTPEVASSAVLAASTPLPVTQPAAPAPSPPRARRSARVRNPSARAAMAQEAMSVGLRTRAPAHSSPPEAGAEAEIRISKPKRSICSAKQTEKGKGKAAAPEEEAQEPSKDESEPRPILRLRLSVALPSWKRKSTNSANTEDKDQETNEPEMRANRARRAKVERTGSTAASARPTRSSARIALGTTTTPATVDATATPLPAPASALAAPASPARRGGPRKATATLTVAPSSRTRRSAAPPPTPIEAQIPKVAAEVECVVKAEPEIPSILEADVEPEVELKSKGKPKAQPKKKVAPKGKPKTKSASETGPKATTTPKKPVTTKASLKKKVEAKLEKPSQPKSDAEPRRSARLRK